MENYIKEVKDVEKDEEQINNNTSNKNKETEKKQFTIFGFSIIQILTYFIIYSIIGFVIETLFGMLTKGVIESRQSFLYGPFCGIYGLGAVIMLMGLQKFKKNNYTLFLGGFIIRFVNRVYYQLYRRMVLSYKMVGLFWYAI